MAKNETFDAIITEMRHRSQEAYEGQSGYPECWRNQIEHDEVDDWIDRIEAALARERETADLPAIHAAEMAERESRGEWRKICAACADGTPPERCAYYGEPNGCNAPVRGHHPAGDAAERLKDELADAHDAIARLEAELAEARRERDTACAERALSAALSAPCRNCDKYGIDDIKKMDADFGAFCRQYGAKDGKNCVGCPIKPMDNLCCHSAWMLLPAKGGAE